MLESAQLLQFYEHIHSPVPALPEPVPDSDTSSNGRNSVGMGTYEKGYSCPGADEDYACSSEHEDELDESTPRHTQQRNQGPNSHVANKWSRIDDRGWANLTHNSRPPDAVIYSGTPTPTRKDQKMQLEMHAASSPHV